MKYHLPPDSFFIENRNRLKELLKPDSLVVFNSNDEMPSNADATYPYIQNSDLFYFTGIDQEQTVLLLCPDSKIPAYREVLFLRETNEHIAVWEGHKFTKEEARKISGIQTVHWLSELDSIMGLLMLRSDNVYLNLNEHERANVVVPYRDLRFANEMKAKYPLHNYCRLAPHTSALRSVKSEAEVELIKTPMAITDKAFRRVLGFVKPDVWEFEIEAEITHEFLRNRASGHAYSPIIASGANACILHYNTNSEQCKKGDLILMDFGACYAHYNADLTRAIPVSGRFTKRQREVYDAVYRVFLECRSMLVPGNTMDKINAEAGKIVESELIQLGLISKTDIKNQDKANPAYKKYFMHGVSHYLGLDVHDVGNRFAPITPGMLFTCEPGIYIPEEGIGIRLENDILVTSDKPIDMMQNIPMHADEIETLMNS